MYAGTTLKIEDFVVTNRGVNFLLHLAKLVILVTICGINHDSHTCHAWSYFEIFFFG